jgi:hypothetical protein
VDDAWPAGSGAVAAAWTEMNDASGGLEQCLLRNPVSALFSNVQKGSTDAEGKTRVPFVKKMKHFYCTKQSKTAQASKAQRSQRLKPQSLSTKCDQKHKAENSSNNKTIAPLASPLSG